MPQNLSFLRDYSPFAALAPRDREMPLTGGSRSSLACHIVKCIAPKARAPGSSPRRRSMRPAAAMGREESVAALRSSRSIPRESIEASARTSRLSATSVGDGYGATLDAIGCVGATIDLATNSLLFPARANNSLRWQKNSLLVCAGNYLVNYCICICFRD